MVKSKANMVDDTYKVGDKLKYVRGLDQPGYRTLSKLEKNELVEVATVRVDGENNARQLGIRTASGRTIKGWHDLDGRLKKNNGYYIEVCYVAKCFVKEAIDMRVNKDFLFRKRNLKNMRCKIISPMPGGSESIVEFTENINGCGADGLGKGGHCLIVDNGALSSIKEDVKTKTIKKK